MPPLGILRKLMTAISRADHKVPNMGEGGRDKIEKMRTAQCDAEGVGGLNFSRCVTNNFLNQLLVAILNILLNQAS